MKKLFFLVAVALISSSAFCGYLNPNWSTNIVSKSTVDTYQIHDWTTFSVYAYTHGQAHSEGNLYFGGVRKLFVESNTGWNASGSYYGPIETCVVRISGYRTSRYSSYGGGVRISW